MRSGSWLGWIALAGGALASSAFADSDSLRERLSGFCVAAHRGGYWYADSNTRVRFETALAEGADIVETDLQVSRDGVPFLFHDVRLDGATRCRGIISDLSARQVESCRIHGLDHGAEPFEKALQWSHGRAVIDAELKSPEAVRPAIDLVRRYDAYEWVYFQVGDGLAMYRQVRAYDARVAIEAGPTGPDGQRLLEELLSYHDPRLLVIQLHGDLISKENVRLIHAHGVLTSLDAFRYGLEWRWGIWPFRRIAACAPVYELGVDIAVTNVPRSCARQRDAAVEAQDGRMRQANVPKPVIAAVRQKYPGARLIRFERETELGKSTYEVGLALDGQKLEVDVTASGVILEEERAIAASDLPAGVKKALAASKYERWTVRRVERVVDPEQRAPPTYELQVVANEGSRAEVLMNEAGTITREQLRKGGGDDE